MKQREQLKEPPAPPSPIHVQVYVFLYCHFLFCLLLLSQVDNKASKSVPVVITVVIVLILSIAVGVVFVKKYVCGGRLVYLGTQDFTPADNLKLSTGKYVEHNKLYNLVLKKCSSCLLCIVFKWLWLTWAMCEFALQVLGSQVLCATAACWGQCCWWDRRTAGDQPHSKWQNRVSWWLRWGTVANFSSLFGTWVIRTSSGH